MQNIDIEKKRVCILAGLSLSRYGYIDSYIQAFESLGYDCTIIAADKKEKPREVKTSYGKLIYICSRFVKLPVMDLPFGYVSRALREDEYTFYFVLAPYPLLAAYILKKMGKRVVYWIGDDNASLFSESLILISPQLKFLKGVLERIYRSLEYRICNNFDCIVTLTESLRNDRTHYKTRIYPIYKCVSMTFSEALNTSELDVEIADSLKGKKVMAYLGEISQSKGLKIILKVFSNVIKKIPNAVLLLVGDFTNRYTSNEDRLYFERYIKEHALEDKVFVTGWVSESKIPGYLSLSQVGLVLLDAWCYSYEISVPDKLIDMLACGLPVVSSEHLGEVRRILTSAKCGIAVDICDINAISDSIVKMLEDENLRRTMSENALSYCNSNHSFKKLEDNLRLIVNDMNIP